MENELTVNDIVTQAADKIKETTNSGESSQNNNNDKNDSERQNEDANKNQQQQSDDKNNQQQQVNPLDEFLKEFNLESVDVLRERLKTPKVDETPEEKEKRESIYQADLQKFAVENGEMKLDDFPKLEAIKNKADRDLVFENWLPSWKEENPDVDPAESDNLAKEAFEDETKLNSTNEKTKARAEAKIAKEAKELRNPLESSFNTVKSKFDTERELRATYPSFNKKIEDIVTENIPAEFNVFTGKDGDADVPIKISITDADKKEILSAVSKKCQSDKTYSLFKKNDFASISEIVKTETENYLWEKKREDGMKEIATKFLSIGTAKGSTVGAKSPFPVVQQNQGNGAQRTKQDAEQEVLDSLSGKK